MTLAHKPHRPLKQYGTHEVGFTMVEMVLTIVIIGIAAVGISSSLALSLRHQSDGMEHARTQSLAQAYLEEILAKRYDENTPLGGVPACSPATTGCSIAANFDDGESRAQYDDVDDYHNVDDLPPVHADGTARVEYQRYRVQVSVSYASATQISDLGLTDPTDAKLVTVTVTAPAASPVAFTVTRANF